MRIPSGNENRETSESGHQEPPNYELEWTAPSLRKRVRYFRNLAASATPSLRRHSTQRWTDSENDSLRRSIE